MISRAFSALGLLALFPLLFLGNTKPPGTASSAPLHPTGGCPELCYRTNAQIEAFLQSIAAAYPQIATLEDAGLSWEGTRHVWLMRLGSRPARSHLPGSKPALYLVADQRPRDVATPEMLLRFISYLTQNYGVDPDVTWLLDNRTIRIIPVANPDGYHQVFFNSDCGRFKNTDTLGCTNPDEQGVDLNRNYPYQWNTGGTSGNPCDISYPGPYALSEPESGHVIAAFASSNSGLVLQLQSPGPTIRYPWGWTPDPPEDAAGLDALGWALARLNGTPRQSVTQQNRGSGTTISGTLDDTMYRTQ